MSRKWLSGSITFTAFLISLWFYSNLPNEVRLPLIGFVSKWIVLFFLPFSLAVLCLWRLNRLMILIITVLALVHWVLLYRSISGELDLDTNIFLFVSFGMGFLYVWLGYLSTFVKQNAGFGLRVSWTLRNEEVWRRANLFAGIGFVFVGLLTIAASLIVTMLYRSSSITEIVLLSSFVLMVIHVVVSLIYTYHVYQEVTGEGKTKK
ncbi:SdpI family protein [Alkalicoccobacillus murimartini]|uniref:Membrane protein n=1 Tax=Alkalicoccobacillus murimartini TaxID=171685 RepID=A0ABT9YMF7_9BACI|nr:SdpI family protein [Alkalicoccobacillus murimartini]MDQ0209065.1 putative membrane protein [Alkalicoccobacillus murimartini]